MSFKYNFHLNVADQLEEYDAIETADKHSRHKAEVKKAKVDEDHRKEEEQAKVEAV